MSGKPHRCHECGHKRGPRVVGPIAKPDAKRGHQGGHPRKKPCNHECHRGEKE